VQQARREASLEVSDRVALTIDWPSSLPTLTADHEAFLRAETLADSVTWAPVAEGFTGTVGDGVEVTVQVQKS
jgi:isoleucyl-tRNA synthetase